MRVHLGAKRSSRPLALVRRMLDGHDNVAFYLHNADRAVSHESLTPLPLVA